MKLKKYILLVIFLWACSLHSQSTGTKVFTLEEFLLIVKKYHPLAKQANIQTNKGNAVLLTAKGGFDPKVFLDNSQKQFNETEYFNLLSSGLKIPTWFGIELKGGFEQNTGFYLNPENVVPASGLLQGGLSITLGQGLFIDERRAALQQARIYKNSVAVQQQLMYNELLYNASNAYWMWFNSYNNLLIYKNAYDFSSQRFDAVKKTVLLGDRAAIDTVESMIQLQNILLGLQQAQLEYKNNSLFLSNFLWYENDIPLEITDELVPRRYNDELPLKYVSDSILININEKIANHPKLKLYQYKLNELSVEKKYNLEKLKPMFNLHYNAISKPFGNEVLFNYNFNNYKLGANFSMPIFLRKERGDLELTRLKIKETEYEMKNKNNELMNITKAAVNEWTNSIDQINLFSKTTANYEALLLAEKNLFDRGESSIFMINSRELGFVNAQLKLIDLVTKNKKTQMHVLYSIVQLVQQ